MFVVVAIFSLNIAILVEIHTQKSLCVKPGYYAFPGHASLVAWLPAVQLVFNPLNSICLPGTTFLLVAALPEWPNISWCSNLHIVMVSDDPMC